MTTGHFQKIEDGENGWCYVRCKAGVSKNYQRESQNLKKGGLIPFGENEFGLDSGLYLELYQRHLNPGNKNMFQKPTWGKKFRKNLHKKKKRDTYYCNSKVGKTYVGYFMPEVNIFNKLIFNCMSLRSRGFKIFL